MHPRTTGTTDPPFVLAHRHTHAHTSSLAVQIAKPHVQWCLFALALHILPVVAAFALLTQV